MSNLVAFARDIDGLPWFQYTVEHLTSVHLQNDQSAPRESEFVRYLRLEDPRIRENFVAKPLVIVLAHALRGCVRTVGLLERPASPSLEPEVTGSAPAQFAGGTCCKVCQPGSGRR